MVVLSFLFFTALVAVLTLILTRKDDHQTSSGYFLGGRKLGGIVIAGSLLLTNLSTEQMVGLNGAAFNDGLAVMVWEVVAVLALVAMALFFLPRFLRSGIATVPQFLESRFNSTTRTIVDVIFLLAYAVILLPIVLYTGATGLVDIISVRELIGIEGDTVAIVGMELDAEALVLWLTVWVVGVIGSCYALFGGLRTVAVSDTLNGIGLLIGGLMITFFGLDAISRTLGDGGGILDGWATMKAHAEPAKTFNSIGSEQTGVPFFTIFTGIALLNLFYWTTNQQIIQRTFGAKNLQAGQKGVLLCGLMKLLGPLYLVLPGIMAYVLYSSDTGFKGDNAYGTLVSDVLPAYLKGFFAAVLVGAILSSFNSALNATCTLFSLGIYKHFINKRADERQTVRSGKVVGWTIAVVAMLIAPLLAQTKSIYTYLQTMNAIYFIPIFAIVLVGMLSKRVPGKAANVALVLGLVLLLSGYFIPIGSTEQTGTEDIPVAQLQQTIDDAEEGVTIELLEEVTIQPTRVVTSFRDFEGPAPEPPEPITYARVQKTEAVKTFFAHSEADRGLMHVYHFMGLVFAVMVAVMLMIGLIAPSPEPWVHEHSGDVDLTPWKGAKPFGVVLVVLVVAIYALFADFSVL